MFAIGTKMLGLLLLTGTALTGASRTSRESRVTARQHYNRHRQRSRLRTADG